MHSNKEKWLICGLSYMIRGNQYVKLWVDKQICHLLNVRFLRTDISFWIHRAKLCSWNTVAQVFVEWMHRGLFSLSWVPDLLPAGTLVHLHFVSSSHSSPAFPNSSLPQTPINASPSQSWRPTSDLCSTEVSRPRGWHTAAAQSTPNPMFAFISKLVGKKKKRINLSMYKRTGTSMGKELNRAKSLELKANCNHPRGRNSCICKPVWLYELPEKY